MIWNKAELVIKTKEIFIGILEIDSCLERVLVFEIIS
jgi:hypothetical protein